ncbi:hypothetical protein MSPP1_000258 [Malassezia sp. CBS 17886]|nr:hypothetical protein MSPP1_000258 [Malassezia sp. CBS 17886]
MASDARRRLSRHWRPSRLVYAMLLALIHIVYHVYRSLIDALHAVPYLLWRPLDSVPARALAGLRIPAHIAVVFPLEAPVPRADSGAPTAWDRHQRLRREMRADSAAADVARLVQWCATAGTRELSVYDKSGVLRARLCTGDAACAMDAMAEPCATHTVTAHVRDGGCRDANVTLHLTPSQGAPPRDKCAVRVNVLSALDDKPAIAQACSAIPTPSPDVRMLDHAIEHLSPMTRPPDVIAVCGGGARAVQLHGFPCWTLRVSEIAYVSTWSSVGRWTAAHFCDTIRQYSRGEQRFGR